MTDVTTNKALRGIKDAEYSALAEFRFHIRAYLEWSDQAAKAAGIEPKQYQLLLAIKGLPQGEDPTVGSLAKQLHIRHHSTVELIDRAEKRELVKRIREGGYVLVQLTGKGERILAKAVQLRLRELRRAGPALVDALRKLIRHGRQNGKAR